MSCMRLPAIRREAETAVSSRETIGAVAKAQTHACSYKRRSTHAHVPSIILPDFYISTPRMREMRAHIYASYMRACSCPCSSRNDWLSLFPDPSFVQCSPRSAALGPSGVVAGGRGTIEQCAKQVQESQVTRLVSKVQTSRSFCF